jgi:hypothetical protein
MRFVLFGMCPYPVFQVLPKMKVVQEGGATYLCAEAAVLDQARAWELVEGTDTADRGRPSSHLALVSPSEFLQIANRVQAALEDYLEVLRAAAADLERCYSATTVCTKQGFPWAWVQHFVVGGWLMDLGLAHIAWVGSCPQTRVGWRVVGFEEPPFPTTECGVRIQWGTAAVLGEFWAENKLKVPRLPTNIEPRELDALHAIVLAGEARAEDYLPKVVSKLRYLGLINLSRGGRLRPAVPIFAKPEWAYLEDCILGWSKQLYEVCWNAQAHVKEDVHRLIFFRCLLTAAYAAAENAGVLLGDTRYVSKNWGLWVWLEPTSSRLLGQGVGAL